MVEGTFQSESKKKAKPEILNVVPTPTIRGLPKIYREVAQDMYKILKDKGATEDQLNEFVKLMHYIAKSTTNANEIQEESFIAIIPSIIENKKFHPDMIELLALTIHGGDTGKIPKEFGSEIIFHGLGLWNALFQNDTYKAMNVDDDAFHLRSIFLATSKSGVVKNIEETHIILRDIIRHKNFDSATLGDLDEFVQKWFSEKKPEKRIAKGKDSKSSI